ncbi:hypothetical protein SAMN05216474_2429 [Lishizhenia tianjinensis]|uniref:Gliding motility protein GldL-like N-terminal domain-containing protein n=1 Tax=Lishizhenia tianjinensis TaxID=477690 RepID=A0A1I7AZY5_9FLAO|nr:hypothetical protein [Lishizhenia tianjinensis]SFT80515.1 hypothetical protein SAMN05216474_2429 [Lishizhenia tianjinensis]
MIFNRLSLLCFAISFVAMAMIFLRYTAFGFSFEDVLRYGVIYVGMLGFIFSILSIYFDKKRKVNTNKNKGLVFYIGAGIVMVGVVFKMMHWPGASIFILAGLTISLLATFLNKLQKSKPESEDLLDS